MSLFHLWKFLLHKLSIFVVRTVHAIQTIFIRTLVAFKRDRSTRCYYKRWIISIHIICIITGHLLFECFVNIFIFKIWLAIFLLQLVDKSIGWVYDTDKKKSHDCERTVKSNYALWVIHKSDCKENTWNDYHHDRVGDRPEVLAGSFIWPNSE